MAIPTQDDINRVIEGRDRAQEAANYADSLVFEMQNISGDNYRMVWSTEYSGGFEPNK